MFVSISQLLLVSTSTGDDDSISAEAPQPDQEMKWVGGSVGWKSISTRLNEQGCENEGESGSNLGVFILSPDLAGNALFSMEIQRSMNSTILASTAALETNIARCAFILPVPHDDSDLTSFYSAHHERDPSRAQLACTDHPYSAVPSFNTRTG